MRREVHFDEADRTDAVAAHRDGVAVGIGGARPRVAVLDAELRMVDEIPVAGEVRSLASSPSGDVLAFGLSPAGRYTVFELGSGRSVEVEVPSTGWIKDARGVAFRTDAELVGIRGFEVGALELSGTRRAFESKHEHEVLHLSVSPDGRRAATADSSKSIRIWDVARGKQIRRLTGRQFGATAFSPDGTVLAWTGGWGGGLHSMGGGWAHLGSFSAASLFTSPPAWQDNASFVFGSSSVLASVDRSGRLTELDRVENAELVRVACGRFGIAAADRKQPRLLVWSARGA